MPRPCKKDHKLGESPNCRLCQLCLDPSEKGRKYRALWNEKEPDGTKIKIKSTPRLVSCGSCKQGVKFKVSPEISVSSVLKLITGKTPASNWPDDWRSYDAVKKAHLMLLDATTVEASKLTYPSEKYQGRGIVMSAGGVCKTYGQEVSYFQQAYSSSYLLRRTGCKLPLEWWFLKDELTDEIKQYAKNVGATCIDAHKLGIQDTMRIPKGWQFKIYAILNSSFKEIIYLDADNICATDPSYLFEEDDYKRTGAVFWGDNPNHWSGRITPDIADRVGLPNITGSIDFETGQMVLDKRKCYQALHIVKHLADHAEYWGGCNGESQGLWYGDKTDFHVGFRKIEKEFVLRGPFIFDEDGGFYKHRDGENNVLFQHACHKKQHIAEGKKIPNLIGNDYLLESKRVINKVPYLDGTIEDSLKLIHPEKYFDVDNYYGRSIWIDVTARNEYKLPDVFDSNELVLDIGANAGSFSYASARRGAKVISVEPCKDTFQSLKRNLLEYRNQITFYNYAVWRSDQSSYKMKLRTQKQHGIEHTAGYSVVINGGDEIEEVETISLDEIVGDKQIRFLKLDCEGSEFPILYTSNRLSQIEEIAGEYHNDADPSLLGSLTYKPNHEGLKAFLQDNGFKVEIVPANEIQGNFFARKR